MLYEVITDVAAALILQRDINQPLADVTSGDWVSIRNVAEVIGQQLNAHVVPSQQRGYESVITSYSIHYTKLYDSKR